MRAAVVLDNRNPRLTKIPEGIQLIRINLIFNVASDHRPSVTILSKGSYWLWIQPVNATPLQNRVLNLKRKRTLAGKWRSVDVMIT